MPAFSFPIEFKSFPNISWWSKEIFVIMDKSASKTQYLKKVLLRLSQDEEKRNKEKNIRTLRP